MADTATLKQMLDNMINQNADQAQVNFHDYLQHKMKEVLSTGDTPPPPSNKTDKKE